MKGSLKWAVAASALLALVPITSGAAAGNKIRKLEFLLAFDTDLRKVKKLVKQIGVDLQSHPELGPALRARGNIYEVQDR